MPVPADEIAIPDGAPWVEIASSIRVPERFAYQAHDQPVEAPVATLHMRVVDGELSCERLELSPRQYQPLSRVGLREVPYGRLLAAVGDALMEHVRVTFQPPPDFPEEQSYWRRQRMIAAEQARAQGMADPVAAAVRTRRRGQAYEVDDDDLRRIAAIYRDAKSLKQRDARKQVQREFTISSATAARWVRRARKAHPELFGSA